MKRLIGDLLNFAKIQAGTLTIETGKVSLKKLVLEAEQSVLHAAIKKRVHMKTQMSTPVDELICDHDRVLEVLSNILGNAVKFSNPGGLVTICVSLRKHDIHFKIQDEGRGIPESYLPHLFDRYWQAKETSRHGAGLGLAIARGIVLSHRGEIWAESKVGSGTVMHFTIPLSQGSSGSSDFQILMA
jgi:signal transduction histidine kinase